MYTFFMAKLNIFRFAQFLHIIAPSDEMFNHMVPDVYWSIENIELSEEINRKLIKNFPRDYKSRKISYRNMCNKIKHLVNGNVLHKI